jgi:hypothetical protein
MSAIESGHGSMGRSRGTPHALRVHAQSVPPKSECHPAAVDRNPPTDRHHVDGA